MKKAIVALLLCASLLFSGCSLLEREYSEVAPHSASYYESENSNVLRAENYQDLVNDLLILVGKQEQDGVIWLYASERITDPEAAVQQACREVQEDTPLGAYAVDYFTYSTNNDNRGYTAISLSISYRRSAEQINSMVHITNLSALTTLLSSAIDNDMEELVLQLSYFSSQEQVREIITSVWATSSDLTPEECPWECNLYPASGDVGIIEIIFGEK